LSASKIEWTEITWNPTTDCDRISPGGDNLLRDDDGEAAQGNGVAEVSERRRSPHQRAGFGVSMHPESVLEPILKSPRTSRIAFLDSMSDVFHARVSAEFLGRIFATIALTP
jgi:protein gp37